MATNVRVGGPLTDAEVSTVVVYVNDLEAMLRFYRDKLGLAVRHQTESYVELRAAGGADIALHAGRQGGAATGQWFLEFRVNEIESVVNELRARGVAVADISERWWGKEASFQDPEGTRLEVEELADAAWT